MLIEIQRMGVRAEPKAGVARGAEARGFWACGFSHIPKSDHYLLLHDYFFLTAFLSRNVQGMQLP